MESKYKILITLLLVFTLPLISALPAVTLGSTSSGSSGGLPAVIFPTPINTSGYNVSHAVFADTAQNALNLGGNSPSFYYPASNPNGYISSTAPWDYNQTIFSIGQTVIGGNINDVLFIDGNGKVAGSDFFNYRNAQLNLTQVNGIVPLIAGNITVLDNINATTFNGLNISTFITSEADTLNSTTSRGNSTTNSIGLGKYGVPMNISESITINQSGIALLTPNPSYPAPTASLAGLGAGAVVNGVHYYRVTCSNDYGESSIGNSGQASITVVDNSTNGQVILTNLPTCGLNATKRTIYRNYQVGTTYMINISDINTTVTSFTDNTRDFTAYETVAYSSRFYTSSGVAPSRMGGVIYGNLGKVAYQVDANGQGWLGQYIHNTDNKLTFQSMNSWKGTDAWQIWADTDEINPSLASNALYISPIGGNKRLFFGSSGNTLYSINLKYVNNWESFPYNTQMSTSTANDGYNDVTGYSHAILGTGIGGSPIMFSTNALMGVRGNNVNGVTRAVNWVSWENGNGAFNSWNAGYKSAFSYYTANSTTVNSSGSPVNLMQTVWGVNSFSSTQNNWIMALDQQGRLAVGTVGSISSTNTPNATLDLRVNATQTYNALEIKNLSGFNYVSIDKIGNTNQINGNSTINNYGAEIWNETDVGYLVTLASVGVDVNLTNFQAGEINGFSFVNGNALKATQSGSYTIQSDVSFNSANGAGQDWFILKNGIEQSNCMSHSTGTGSDVAITIHCKTRLNVGDTINLAVHDDANPVKNPTIKFENILIDRNWN